MSGPADDPKRFDLDSYATLRARLALEDTDRERLLAEHDLDEESWDRIDEAWQDQLSRDLEAQGDDVPASITQYSQRFEQVQRDAPGRVISLELFGECTHTVQQATDPKKALAKLGVTLSEFLKANQHWSPRITREPAIAERFKRALK
jgi:hypothetical protein